jgi:DNA-directed RNA polymerase subunit omega
MAKIPSDTLDEIAPSKYALVMAVAKRAKQLREGAPKLVESKSRNSITIALAEITSGKVRMIVPTQEQMDVAERMESATTSRAREAADLLRAAQAEMETPTEPRAEVVTEAPSEAVAEVETVEAAKIAETEEELEESFKAEALAEQELMPDVETPAAVVEEQAPVIESAVAVVEEETPGAEAMVEVTEAPPAELAAEEKPKKKRAKKSE